MAVGAAAKTDQVDYLPSDRWFEGDRSPRAWARFELGISGIYWLLKFVGLNFLVLDLKQEDQLSSL